MASWLDAESATRLTQTALAYRMLRAFIRWCALQDDYQPSTHLEAVGPHMAKDHVPRSSEKEGDCLQREQLPTRFQAVRHLPPLQAAYLQVLLLTGARREELAGLKWADVDFQWNSLSIADKVEEIGIAQPAEAQEGLRLMQR